MTDVNSANARTIGSIAEARSLYTKTPADMAGKIGLEVEMHLFIPQESGVGIPPPGAMEELRRDLAARGHDAQLEATGVLEYASPPAALGDVASLVRKVENDLSDFSSAAAAAGFRRAPFSVMPSMTVGDALEKMGTRERLRVGIGAVREIFPPEAACVPLLTTGVQASFSPRDEGELHRMAMRAYVLTPLLIAAMNSASGFAEGEKIDHHPRGRFYRGYGASGGISPAFLQSDSPDSFIDGHIREVFSAPMPFAYDGQGKMMPSTAGNVLSFDRLLDMGLGTQANYELAESFLYHDVKICNLRGANGQTLGKRIEVRAADSGLHQPASVLLLTAALVPDGPAATAFEDLLRGFGFTGLMPEDGKLLSSARTAAVEHGGRFMDVPFGVDPGTGQPRRLTELAKGVADILQGHYKGRELDCELSELTGILVTGGCDAKRYAGMFRSPAEAEEFLLSGGDQPRMEARNSSLRSSSPRNAPR